MKLPVVLRDEALAEFDEALDYYDGLQPGLGTDFVARVQQVFDHIAANPRMHAVRFADVRKAVVRRFPYSSPGGSGARGGDRGLPQQA